MKTNQRKHHKHSRTLEISCVKIAETIYWFHLCLLNLQDLYMKFILVLSKTFDYHYVDQKLVFCDQCKL